MSEAQPTVSIEVERKYDVDAAATVPVLRALPGAASFDGPVHRALDAVYFDSVDAVLARAQVALRRREGGPDAGWHIKGPKLPGGGRRELQWPLGDAAAVGIGTRSAATPAPATAAGGAAPEETAATGAAVVLPAAVAEAVAHWSGGAPMLPLARVQNAREVWNVRDAHGGVLIEFVDDHVTGTDLRGGAVRSWREWEAELGPAAPADAPGREALFAALEALVLAAGGRVSASASKLGRALGVTGDAD
ncbi:MAG: CYTH domain-containing protein [Microbacteriaceae bacterium]|nr:CYTH domain-containing protein [Microbacteriaceae bacterium]